MSQVRWPTPPRWGRVAVVALSTSLVLLRAALAQTTPPATSAATPAATPAATSAATPAATPATSSASFNAWSESFAADWVRLSPEWATNTQYFGREEMDRLNAQLAPITTAQRALRRVLALQGLARLTAFEAQALSAEDRVSAAILRWSLQGAVAGEAFADHRFVFNQQWGPHLRYIDLLAQQQPLRRAADLDIFLARLDQVELRLDEAIAVSRSAAARGLLPPRFIVERVRGQVQAFLAQGAADNDIIGALARRGALIEGMHGDDRPRAVQAALDRATATLQVRVRPAYERVLAWLNELHPRTTADAGQWRLPDGAAAYAQDLANFTTTDMGAEQIHALGLVEVARIEKQMDALLQTLGRREGTVLARMNTMRAEQQPPADPDPRPALLERYAAAVRDAQQRAQPLFNLQPRAPVEVRRVPSLTERTASAYYTTPAPDGSRPGIFWLPLPGPSFDLLRLRSLAVHEAVPGHHFQLALQQEQRDLPQWRQRRIFGGGSAHSEGWALYAERLAIDQGWYEGDAPGLLGALDGQLFRARRLVVDTGLHAKRWTREQAIAYGISASEVERYVSNPGQATAYMVGMLHLLALRGEVQQKLGAKFSLPAFHDVVLKTGSVPLQVLSDVVRRWAADLEGKS